MSCKGRVTDVVFENCTATVYYSDCTSITYDISNCGDKTPDDKDPGDWPPPDPVEDVRCRVAIHLGDDIVERFMDFLNNLNLVNPAANVPAYTYAINRISVYGWPIGVHGAVVNFYNSLGIGTSFIGNTAKGYYDNNTALALATVQEALYCVLPSNADIDEVTREVFVAALRGIGGEFYTLLADFVTLWPLSDIRYLAALASTTTDEIDCSSFNCAGVPSGDPCAEVDLVWASVAATPATWENVPGTIDTSGWSGDTDGITQSPPGSNVDYTASRGSNENWVHSGASNTAIGVAIRYTPAVPCVVTHAQFAYSKNAPNSILLAIVGRRASDGVYQVLKKEVRPAVQPLSGQLIWTGSPIALSEVLFIVHSSANSGTAQVRITANKVNDP